MQTQSASGSKGSRLPPWLQSTVRRGSAGCDAGVGVGHGVDHRGRAFRGVLEACAAVVQRHRQIDGRVRGDLGRGAVVRRDALAAVRADGHGVGDGRGAGRPGVGDRHRVGDDPARARRHVAHGEGAGAARRRRPAAQAQSGWLCAGSKVASTGTVSVITTLVAGTTPVLV